MNNPMDGEFINKEIQEMEFLQSLVSSMSKEAETTDNIEFLIEYHHILYALLDKQHVIYTRMIVESDPESVESARILVEEANRIGKDPDMSMSMFYSESKAQVKDHIEYLGGDVSDLNVDTDWI